MESTVSNFSADLEMAHKDEQFICELFGANTLDYDITWVGDNKEHWHDGDIQISDGINTWYADVKSDNTCYRTGNILAEHRVKWRGTGWTDGFMQKCHYDYVFYLSKTDKKIYIIDFAKWQSVYTRKYKRHIYIEHNDKNGCWLQTTDGYLLQIKKAKELGVIIAEYNYDDSLNLIEKTA